MAVHKRYKVESDQDVDDSWCIEIEDHDRRGEREEEPMLELTMARPQGTDGTTVWMREADLEELVDVLQTVLRGE